MYNIDGIVSTQVTGNLSIFSNPQGAEIFIDGTDQNRKANDILTLPEGIHEIRLVLKSYMDWVGSFEVITGRTQVVYAILWPSPAPLMNLGLILFGVVIGYSMYSVTKRMVKGIVIST
jgi:hypothetical protein